MTILPSHKSKLHEQYEVLDKKIVYTIHINNMLSYNILFKTFFYSCKKILIRVYSKNNF